MRHDGPRGYPDEPAGPFPEPPLSFVDGEDRDIEVRPYDPDDFEALVGMYVAFDPADRAQGIPPAAEDRIREWLEDLLDGLDAVAWHGDRAVGHATLVPDGSGAYELAIFVVRPYQGAGIGTALLEALLGLGRREGVEAVWLTVERWNTPAVRLYRSVGFETCGEESFELEMSIRL